MTIVGKPGEPESLLMARGLLRLTVQAASTLQEYNRNLPNLELEGLVAALGEQTSGTIDGDLSRAEGMLTAKAHTLDAIFNNPARRAINAEYTGSLWARREAAICGVARA